MVVLFGGWHVTVRTNGDSAGASVGVDLMAALTPLCPLKAASRVS